MGPAGAIDTLLARSIVLGYGEVGLRIRRQLRGRFWDLCESLVSL